MRYTMRRNAPIILTLAATLAACAAPGAGQNATKPADAPTQTPTSVRAITVNAGALTTNRTVSGTLEAGVDSSIAAQTSGQVTAVLHREGERVQSGETILKLDDTSLRQQLTDAQLQLRTAQINLSTSQRKTPETTTQNQSSFQSAQISLDKARKTYEANQAVFKIGGLSQTDLETSKANLAQAQANFEQAQASLSQSQRAKSENLALLQVQVEQAQNKIAQTQRSLSLTNIKAPFAGEIADLSTEVGEFVNTGAKVLRLVDTSSLRARFKVPTQDANTLRTGSGVRIVALGRSLEGRVTRSTQVAGSNRLVEILARMVGGQNLAGFTAGTTVQVAYSLKLAQGVIVPTGALQTASGQTYVYIVKDGQAVQRNVNVLGESGSKVAVKGLEAGTRVIYPVPGSLQSGERISIVTANSGSGGATK
jgi:HlyD family secretion protein